MADDIIRPPQGRPAAAGGTPPTIQVGPDFGNPPEPEIGVSVALSEVEAATEQGVSVSPALSDVDVTMPAQDVTVQPAFPSVEVTMPAQSVGADVSKLRAETSDILADKDSWVDTVALCAVDLNHNGTDLEVSGTAGATKDAYIGFDMSRFPSDATIESATLTLHVKTAPLDTDQRINIFKIADADEGWGEAAIKCSNRPPANGGSMQNFMSGLVNDVEKTLILNATVIARLQERMGLGNCTLLLQNQAVDLLTTIFQSTDEGVDDAEGPRLLLVMDCAV